jgi:hypothetical protein
MVCALRHVNSRVILLLAFILTGLDGFSNPRPGAGVVPRCQSFIQFLGSRTHNDVKFLRIHSHTGGSCTKKRLNRGLERLMCIESETGPRSPSPQSPQQDLKPEKFVGKSHANRAPPLLPPGGASTFWDTQVQDAKTGGPLTKVLVLGATRTHSATVIWLHGRDGDTAESWAIAAQKLQVPWCKFLFPVSRQGWFLGETEAELRRASDMVLDLVGGSAHNDTCCVPCI